MYDWYVVLSPVALCMHHGNANKSYGAIPRPIKNGFVKNCVEVFMLHRDKHQYRFPLG